MRLAFHGPKVAVVRRWHRHKRVGVVPEDGKVPGRVLGLGSSDQSISASYLPVTNT